MVPSEVMRGDTPAEGRPADESPAEDGIGEPIDPNRGEKVSELGERALRSKERCGGGAARDPPSIPNPGPGAPYSYLGSPSGVGDGGVGVRGGAGIGILEAMVASW